MTNGIFIAIIAQVFLGISIVVDKYILHSKEGRKPISYVFWIGVLNVFGVAFLFYKFQTPSLLLVGLSALAGFTFLLALLFYYRAIYEGAVSEAAPVIGGLAPIATYYLENLLGFTDINIAEKLAFGILVFSGFLFLASQKVNFKKVLPWAVLASIFTALATILEKMVFSETTFGTGFGLMKLFSFVSAALILLIPKFREQIISDSRGTSSRHGMQYFANRILAAVGSFLIFYSISLENRPALIEAVAGLRYAIIFILAYLLWKLDYKELKDKFSGWTFVLKIVATIFIVVGLGILALQRYYSLTPYPEQKASWGVTFSTKMAESFGLDPKKTLEEIVSGLRPQTVRIATYWDEIQKSESEYDFSKVDWQMNMLRDSSATAILAYGQKTPRWPECHIPAWLKSRPIEEKNAELLKYVAIMTERYKDYSNLKYLQVENEPFLIFGECPPPDANLLEKEIAAVKTIDKIHPILGTDGGEFGDWYRIAKRADIFGTTLYRKVNTDLFGRITYPLTPEFYPLKADLVKLFTRKPEQKFIVAELGLEPWTKKQIYEISVDEQVELLPLQEFEGNIEYAKQTKFDEFYMWGVEWWYWLKTTKNFPHYWDIAKKIISD
jgi:uncharacterized membrane protein